MEQQQQQHYHLFWSLSFCFFCYSFLSSPLLPSSAHNNGGAPPPDCHRPSASSLTLRASFHPGVITVDADSSDWASITGAQTFIPLQAIQPDPDLPYPYGSFIIKVNGPSYIFICFFVYLCAYVCMYVCMRVYVYMYVCMRG